MAEENLVAFNAAVDMYTELLFEQKEILFRIIETSYNKGYEAARRDIAVAMQQAAEEERQVAIQEAQQYERERIQAPPQPQTQQTHSEEQKFPEQKFTDRLKAGMPRR